MDRGATHHHNDHDDHADAPIACLACGYSRVGIEPRAACPECGAAAPRVIDRALAHPWVCLALDDRRRTQRGLALVTVGLAGFILCLVAQLGLAFRSGATRPTSGFAAQDILNVIAALTVVATQAGWWIALPRAVVEMIDGALAAIVVRITLILAPLCVVAMTFGPIGAPHSSIAITLLIAVAVQIIVTGHMLRRLTHGTKGLSLGDSIRTIVVPIVITLLPFALFGTTLGVFLLMPYWLLVVIGTRLALRDVLRQA